MNARFRTLSALAVLVFVPLRLQPTAAPVKIPPLRPLPTPPPAPREFRAAWVATVNNIDWPSKRGLPVEQQKREILAILDRAVELNLNAIVLQVRPACDALYPSKLEPWSEYLTGEMGRPPAPYYDPLQMWVDEAHKRGLELHCWFNPYRAHHPTGKSPISADHVSRTKPAITKTYGTHLWLDPGEKETQDYSIAVVMDVVNRYPIDGVHMDDYFYPYKEKDAAGNIIPFPDDPSWQKYTESGGSLTRDDWRRENVNQFVRRLYARIKAAKPAVKLGISPFGIWRPGNPPQIKGFDQYSELYADARKWLQEGWVDYWTPQLYWPIAQAAQSYPVLLSWWADQNTKARNLWPGNYTSRVGDGSAKSWPAAEIVEQVKTTRGVPGATGNVHFSMVTLMRNRGLCSALKQSVYKDQALVPASPWLDGTAPRKPRVVTDRSSETVTWRGSASEAAWLWLVQSYENGTWRHRILPGGTDSYRAAGPVDAVAVSAVDRCGNVSDPAIVAMR